MLGKVLLFASAATMTALLASGCQGNAALSAGSGPTSTTTAQSAPATFPGMTTPPPASTGSGAAPTSATQSTAASPAGGQFTNKTLHVILTSASSSTMMIKFQLAAFHHDPTDDGSWSPDPSNPGTHQLALAPAATVLSAASWCPTSGGTSIDAEGVGNGPCTVTQLLEVFQSTPGGPGAAVITTDDQDHIVKIAEIYHP